MATILKLAAAAAAALAVSCAGGGASRSSRSGGAPKDQIMWIRKNPPTYGFERLRAEAAIYPDLAYFLTLRGQPDFLAETGNDGRNYLILYYLHDRHAFACRTVERDRKAVEFSGPYPITGREFKLLDDFRKDPRRKSLEF
jgi:hypothetical protein